MKKSVDILLAIMVLGVMDVCPLWAKVIYVNRGAVGVKSGSNWQDAYTDLHIALETSQSGDEIWVTAGIYKPTQDTDRSKSFLMRDGVSLYGGFLGNEIRRTDRDWAANTTALSGDIGEQGNHSDNSYHVLRGANNAALDGFVVCFGRASGGGIDSYGGGMFNNSCSPTVANCTFIENSANGQGGAMWNRGLIEVVNCTFMKNHGGSGGAIYNDGHVGPGKYTIIDCRFSNNTSGQGGGVFNYECTTTLKRCVFAGNSVVQSGGGMCGYMSNQILTNCVFVGNSAYEAGGIDHIGHWGRTDMVNCTLTSNRAEYNGGGVYLTSASPSNITNCVLWGNTGVNGQQLYIFNTTVSVSHSNIQGGWEGDGNIDADPLFMRVPHDGGDGWGVGDNDDFGDLRVSWGSLCIDTGNNSFVPPDITTDIAGNPRIIDGNGDGQAIVDMGAHEFWLGQSEWLTVVSPNGGEMFSAGTPLTLRWLSKGIISSVLISYTTDDGDSWIDITTVENTGSYEWTVPVVSSEHCLIRVSDLSNSMVQSTSDSVFSIFECRPPILGDLNGDCYVNLLDMAILAENWLKCGDPFNPLCQENQKVVQDLPFGMVSVDGDLSDWPKDITWTELNKIYSGQPDDIVKADFALLWNDQTNKIYVAIRVEDMDHFLADEYIYWHSSDRAEVYCQGTGLGGTGFRYIYDTAQQYYIAANTTGRSWASWAYGDEIDPDMGFEQVVRVDGNTFVYEIAVPVFEYYGGFTGQETVPSDLYAGKEVGFDITVLTRRQDGGYGMLSQNRVTGKYLNADAFARYVLVEKEVGADDVVVIPITWVYINDPGVSGHEAFNGHMSKYEITNAQYCQFLNAALVSDEIYIAGNYVVNLKPYYWGSGRYYYQFNGPGSTSDGVTNGGKSRINYSGGECTVESGFENHPVTYVSWYGATAFAHFYGWRLPTEWEWQAVADYDGSYNYGCGPVINKDVANCEGSNYPHGTTPVGFFGAYGYGMADMAGNVWEWTSSESDLEVIPDLLKVIRGGSWCNGSCAVSRQDYDDEMDMGLNLGFRVCR